MHLGIPLILGVVLIASGALKLRTPDDVSGWASLGVPAFLRRPWLVRVHPWAEILLGVGAIVCGGWLGALVALGALVLMAAYTVLIARALKRPEDASCACFGEAAPITGATLLRNIWLTLLAALAVASASATPLVGGALRQLASDGPSAWGWALVALASAVTVAVILRAATPAQEATQPVPASASAADADQLEYLRQVTPAIPVTLGDGSVATLRDLSAARPLLLLAVRETCGACHPVIDNVEQWRELLPVVDVRLLLESPPEDTALTRTSEPQTLHDPKGWVRQTFGPWGTPTALLLGADGSLAGGPVSGPSAVEEFVADIRAELTDAGALPA